MKISKEQSFIIAKRLKELRESSGLSHEKLSKALKEQCGCSISADSLMNYEAPDEFHTKKYKNLGMKIESLLYLATFYGVSSDYILGLTDIKADNFAVRKIAELTGISAVNVGLLIVNNALAKNFSVKEVAKLTGINEYIPKDNSVTDDDSECAKSLIALADLLLSCCQCHEVAESFQNIYATAKAKHHANEETFDIDPIVSIARYNGFSVLTGNQFIGYKSREIAEMIRKEITDKYKVEETLYPAKRVITFKDE